MMPNHRHFNFDLQLFAGDGEGTPASPSLTDILAQIDERPVGYDHVPAESDDKPADTEQSAEQPTADTDKAPEPAEQQEEEYDEIVYNKETIRIPKSERQALLQKGYNYEKVHNQKAELERQMQLVDAWVKDNYGEHGINSWDEWQNALAAREREETLQEAGLDEEAYTKLIENDPELKKLRDEAAALKKQTEEQAINQRLQSEVDSLNATYDLKLKTIDDVLTLPNAERIIEIARTSGLPLTDCYLLANRTELMQQQTKAAVQKDRTKVASKSHIKDTAKASDSVDLVQVPNDVYSMYKQLMPDLTRRQIAEHYAKSIKEG